MPDTRPNIVLKDGVCLACINHETNKTIDYDSRFFRFKMLCNSYKDIKPYNCIIAVSGGKDSHYITYVVKEKLGLTPLLVNVVDPFTKTQVGLDNLRNLTEVFDCSLYTFTPSPKNMKESIKKDFHDDLIPLRYLERLIYTMPPYFGKCLGIPLIFYGEYSPYFYGETEVDRGFTEHFKPIYLSYYTGWDDERNLEIAMKYGFKKLEHAREGLIENYSQIDSVAYLIHVWCKYPKFGFGRVTDIASRWVRKGKISREEGMELVLKYDYILDDKILQDFLQFTGYSNAEFWEIVNRFEVVY